MFKLCLFENFKFCAFIKIYQVTCKYRVPSDLLKIKKISKWGWLHTPLVCIAFSDEQDAALLRPAQSLL